MIGRTSNRTAAAALLYWLLVMCGLAGLSIVRANSPREYVPLWLGSVAGVGLGQLIARLRLRAWVIAVTTVVMLGVSPVLFAVAYAMLGYFDLGLEPCLLAFFPAAVCGYLSLSERGGLVAFWFPAMLWMLVILDRPGGGAFDTRAALPLAIALGAMFVAWLRARETRKTALWQEHATVRLADPLTRTALRTSPLRSASQHAWTALVGAGALVLAAWVAPHLWKKESARPHARPTYEETSALVMGDPSEAPCCNAAELEEERRERVREYIPLVHGQDSGGALTAPKRSCARCEGRKHPRSLAPGATAGGSATRKATAGMAGGGSPSGWTSTDDTNYAGGNGYGYGSGGSYGGHVPPAEPADAPRTLSPVPVPPAPIGPIAEAPPFGAHPPVAPDPTKADLVVVPAPPPVATASTPAKPVAVLVPAPPATPVDTGTPWRSALALCMGGLALHVLLRAARRQLTLRHLARPFWRETLDQRISNHWQRMLIGLRDAGIHPRSDEQPQALARRVGIEGMSTCATILERVRHGVRIDAKDLDAMDRAAAAAYRTARKRAGLAGRAAGLVRSPL